MPYKDPEKRKQRYKERMEKIKDNPVKYAEYREKMNEQQRKWRASHSNEKKETLLETRRLLYQINNPGSTPRIRFDSEEGRIEHNKTYKRRYMRKYRKKYPEKHKAVLKKYQENLSPEKKEKQQQRKISNTRKWRMAHPDAPQIYYKRSKEKWTNGLDCRDPEIWKTAEIIATNLIKTLGYTDPFQPKFKYFYFDIIAKKNGRFAVFQVTTLRTRVIKRKHIELVNYFGWDFFIIQVKPTFDFAYMQKIVTDPIPKTKTVSYHYAKGHEYSLTDIDSH